MTNYTGMATAKDQGDEYAQLSFVIQQLIAEKCTISIARVIAVNNTGGVSAVGYLDAQPMVQQVDGTGAAVPHAPIHNLPYLRAQGGANAVICDPEVGDIGIVAFASRDISTVKNTKVDAPPPTKRRFNMSDGLWIGGILNGTPSQYLQFTDAGINLAAPLVAVPGNFQSGSGYNGSFATGDGRNVTVRGGLITNVSDGT